MKLHPEIRLAFLLLVVLSIPSGLGCGGGSLKQASTSSPASTHGSAPAPTLAFSDSPATIVSGNSSTLSWITTGATSLSINNGVGQQQNVAAGSVTVSPAATTTYIATASGANNQTVTQQVIVAVTAPPQSPPQAPTLTFSASPAIIDAGRSSTLNWVTANALSLTIDNGLGSQLNVAAGTLAVAPTNTTTYIATAIGADDQTATQMAVVTVNPAPPQHGIVVMVMEENHSYEQAIGPKSPMPFLNSLAQRGALLTQYFADAHPSLPNYLELTSGAMETLDDNFAGVLSNDNLARELPASGKTWKAYAEDLPVVAYLGGDTANYVKHHNPFAYYSDVVNSAAQAANIVPFTQFSADMNSGTLPNFSFVVPDLLDDAHNCPNGFTCSDSDMLSRADQWLSTNVGPLLSSFQFQKDGLLLIVFDESDPADMQHGGGHVAVVAVGPKVKVGFESAVFYQHENTLGTICQALAVTNCPGSGATASSESDIFQ